MLMPFFLPIHTRTHIHTHTHKYTGYISVVGSERVCGAQGLLELVE
jgi:hypothetical protein